MSDTKGSPERRGLVARFFEALRERTVDAAAMATLGAVSAAVTVIAPWAAWWAPALAYAIGVLVVTTWITARARRRTRAAESARCVAEGERDASARRAEEAEAYLTNKRLDRDQRLAQFRLMLSNLLLRGREYRKEIEGVAGMQGDQGVLGAALAKARQLHARFGDIAHDQVAGALLPDTEIREGYPDPVPHGPTMATECEALCASILKHERYLQGVSEQVREHHIREDFRWRA